MTTTTEAPMALFDRIGGEYLSGHEVSMTWPNAKLHVRRRPEPVEMGIRGWVNALRSGLDLAAPPVVRPLRAYLLSRAEDMIAAFAAEGWVLDSAPRFDFAGSLHHAQVRLPRTLIPPQEHGIGLQVDLSLVHFDLEPAS